MGDKRKWEISRAPSFFSVGGLTQEQRAERDLASYAHEQDLYKHVATLSSGAVVILTTFLDKLTSTSPHWKPLVSVSLASFAGSVVAVVLMQLLSVRSVNQLPDQLPGFWGVLGAWLLLIGGFGGFILGVVSLTLFGIKNV